MHERRRLRARCDTPLVQPQKCCLCGSRLIRRSSRRSGRTSPTSTSTVIDAGWPGAATTGYGIFTWPGADGRRVKFRAHRVSLELTAGPAPVGAPWALHRWPCHLRDCVAADHLYWGTPLQNSADRDSPARRAQLRSARDEAGGQLRLL